MKSVIQLLNAYFLLQPSSCALIASEEEPTRSDRLRVMTYNVQFLPEPVSDRNERPHPQYRAQCIAEAASRFDIIVLQETFHDEHRQQIIDRVAEVWAGTTYTIQSPTPTGFFTSGGCLIISKMPVVAQHSTVFANYSNPAQYGFKADGFAAKGVLHARIAHPSSAPSDFVDVFATHLEARADDLRPLQYEELAKFVKQHASPNHPALLLGDLNTRGGPEFRRDAESQYSQLMRHLSSAREGGEWVDIWPQLKGDALGGTTEQASADVGKRIDYILISNPRRPNSQLGTNVPSKSICTETQKSRHSPITMRLPQNWNGNEGFRNLSGAIVVNDFATVPHTCLLKTLRIGCELRELSSNGFAAIGKRTSSGFEQLAREAAVRGVHVVCTTECFLDGYAIDDKSIPLEQFRALGEPIPDGRFYKRLCELSDELDIHLIARIARA